MSIGPDESLGNVFVRVGYDISDLDRQEREIESRVRRFAARVNRGGGGGGPQGPGGGGGPGAMDPSPAINRAAAGIIGQIGRVNGPIVPALRGGFTQLTRAVDAGTDQMKAVAGKLKVVAEASKEQVLAANDFRRAAQQGRGRAALNTRLNQVFGGNRPTDPNMRIGHIAAESRFFSGVGFGGSGEGGAPAAAIAAPQLDRAGDKLQQAATMLGRSALSMQRSARPGVAGVIGPATGDLVTRIGVTPAAAVMGARGAHLQRRRSGVIDWQASPTGGPREPGATQSNQATGIAAPLIKGPGSIEARIGTAVGGAVHSALRRLGVGGVARGGLAGVVAAGKGGALLGGAGKLAGGAAGLAGQFGPGALAAMLPTLQAIAPAAGVASVAILGLGNTINLLKAPVRIAENGLRHLEHSIVGFRHAPLTRALGSIGGAVASGVTFPLRLAGRALGVFDSRASATTNALRLMGRVAGGLRFSLAMPFRLALSPITALTGSLRNLTAMATLLGPALALGGLYKAIEAAGHLETTSRRVETAFHDASGTIFALADEMADRFGKVSEKTLDLASNLGLMFTGTGIAEGRAASMASELTELAADMAATFGVAQDELKGAFVSALAGQFEPLRRYDVLLRQSDVNQRAVAKGLARTTDEVSFQAKALATYSLIMDRTTKFQGGLERNMNTFGNLVQEIRGRVVNFATAIGARLLPAAREFALLVVDLLSGPGAGQGLLNAVGYVGDRLRDAIHFVRQMAASIDDVRIIVREVGDAVSENWGAVWGAVGETAVNVLGTAFDALRHALKAVWNLVGSDMAQTLADAGMRAAGSIARDLKDAFLGIWDVNHDITKRRLEEARQQRARDRAAADRNQAKATEILGTLGGFVVVPDVLDREAEKAIKAALDRIRSRTLRGDDDTGGPLATPRHGPEGPEGGGAGDKSRTGQRVTAEQLWEMQAQGELGRKQVDLLGQIAANTARLTPRGAAGQLAGASVVAAMGGASGLTGALGQAAMGLAPTTGARRSRADIIRDRTIPFVGPPEPHVAARLGGDRERRSRSKIIRDRAREQAAEMAGRRDKGGAKDDKIEKNTRDQLGVLKRIEKALTRGGPVVAVAGP